MVHFKLATALLFLLVTLTGCDLLKTEKDHLLLTSVTKTETHLDKKEWDQALANINDFQDLYNQRKWKLQLLGELEDYKEIESEIISLKVSLKDEDELESRIGLGEIIYRLNVIYNL